MYKLQVFKYGEWKDVSLIRQPVDDSDAINMLVGVKIASQDRWRMLRTTIVVIDDTDFYKDTSDV